MDVTTYALLNKKIGSLGTAVSAISDGFTYKGSVASTSDFPGSPDAGDMYTVGGIKYVYDGTDWVQVISDDLDTTLAVTGKAADAKATGDAIAVVVGDVDDLDDKIDGVSDDVTDVAAKVGTLSNLVTQTKTDVVSAINEVAQTHGSASAVSILSPNVTTLELQPCPITYKWGEVASLTLTVTAITQYHFMFTCPAGSATTLTLTGITGTEGDELAAGKTYEVDIWAGIAMIREMDITPVEEEEEEENEGES